MNDLEDIIDEKWRPLYYDKQGNPMGLFEWARYFEDNIFDYRRVGWTKLRGPAKGRKIVSTVWVGLDHSFGIGGRPLIFETMVFYCGDMSGIYQGRWATLEEAEYWHKEICRLYQYNRKQRRRYEKQRKTKRQTKEHPISRIGDQEGSIGDRSLTNRSG